MIKNQDNIVVYFPSGGYISFSRKLTVEQIKRFFGPGWRLKWVR
jgi:hypothetical protein